MISRNQPIQTTSVIFKTRYPEARVIFMAGSVVRGEGTATSDLDLVVVFDQLPCAYRESFIFDQWPIEAFVHDPQTLEYFFREVDAPSGYPSLPTMVTEGIEVPGANDFTASLKVMAQAVLDQGPPEWDVDELDKSRYMITDLIDDIRDPRSRQQMHATATQLYSALANHYFRSRNLWSAQGKSIPGRLEAVDSRFADQFLQSFDEVFSRHCASKLIDLAAEIVARDGGFLFAGYRLNAPASWRQG